MRKTLLTTVSVLALGFGSAAWADDAATDLEIDNQAQYETDAEFGTGIDGTLDTDMSVDTDIDSDFGSAGVDTGVGATGSTLGAFTAEELIDSTVIGVDGEQIAEVSDLVLGANNEVTDVLVNVGGFLGIGQKVVALDVNSLQVTQDESGDTMIVTNLTEEQLENMASFEATESTRLQSGVDSGIYDMDVDTY